MVMNNPLLCNDRHKFTNWWISMALKLFDIVSGIRAGARSHGFSKEETNPPPLFLKKLLPPPPPILLKWKLLLSLSEVTRAENYQPSYSITPWKYAAICAWRLGREYPKHQAGTTWRKNCLITRLWLLYLVMFPNILKLITKLLVFFRRHKKK